MLKFVQPPETFDESFEFDHEIETAEPLLFMLRRFLEQFSFRLSSIYLIVRELTLRPSFQFWDLLSSRIACTTIGSLFGNLYRGSLVGSALRVTCSARETTVNRVLLWRNACEESAI